MDFQSPSRSIGPFTKDNFDINEWDSIISVINHLNDIDTNKTRSALEKTLKLIHELNTCIDYKNYFQDTLIYDYFFAKFLPGFVNAILKTEQVDNLAILQLSNDCLEQVTLLWSKAIYEDHAELNNMAAALFNVEQPYFKANNKEDILPSVISSFPPPSQEHQAWIQTIKQGDFVDCIKGTKESDDKIMCWSHAEVIQVSSDIIRVAFLQEDEGSAIKDLNPVLNANEIALYKTKCKDFDWRMNLKIGDELDVLDTTKTWYRSTVIDVRTTLNNKTNREYKSLLIGYRKYDENGTKYDFYGRQFAGWTSRFDEWITVTSPRLCMKGIINKNVTS